MTPSKRPFDVTGASKYLVEGYTAILSARAILKSEGYSYSIVPWIAVTPFLLMFVAPFVLYGATLDFRTVDGVYHISNDTLYYALSICTSWLMLAGVSAYLFSRISLQKISVKYWNRSEVIRVFVILCVIGLPVFVFHQLFKLPPAFENLVHIVSISAYLAFGLGIGLIFAHRRNARRHPVSSEHILTCTLFAALAILPTFLGKAVEAACASAVLIASLAIVRVRPVMKCTAILLAGSVVTATMAIKHPIRQVLYHGSVYTRIDIDTECLRNISYCLYDKLPFRSRSMENPFPNDMIQFSSYDPNYNKLILTRITPGEISHYLIARVVHRLNHLGSLAHAVSLTPDAIPFWNWRTYAVIPYVFIPRLIWHNKPMMGFANLFGRQYGILQSDDVDTTMNIDHVTEAWINAGWLGIAFSSVSIGALLGTLFGWLRAGGDQDARFMVAIIFAINVPYFESEAALMVGGLLQQLVFLGGMLVIIRLLTKGRLLTQWRRLFRNPAEAAVPSKG